MKSNRLIKRLDWYIIKKFLGTYVFAIALIFFNCGGVRLQREGWTS